MCAGLCLTRNFYFLRQKDINIVCISLHVSHYLATLEYQVMETEKAEASGGKVTKAAQKAQKKK